MILPFKTKFENGEPTHFVEKIYYSIYYSICNFQQKQLHLGLSQKLVDFYESEQFKELSLNYWDNAYWKQLTQGKPHTIRADEKNRWKAGNLIHFYINNRQPDMLKFAPVLKCTGVQKIWIDPVGIEVDDKLVDEELVARNDGFRDFKHMLEFFPETFTGKIIHWTDLRY